MRKQIVLAIVTISVLALVANATQYPLMSCAQNYTPQTEKAVKYLTDVMFVPTIGLDKCSPIAESHTVWLTNDNLLAYAVLLSFNSSMAETLKQGLDKYNVSGNGLVEVSLNQTIEPIRGHNNYNITTIDQYTLKEDIRDGGVMYDFQDFADLCFWWSQNLLLKHDVNGAIASFEKGMAMWNGTGFLDKPFNESYNKISHNYDAKFQTFKVGLALWMAERLNYTTGGKLYQQTSFTDADYTEMQNIICRLQDPKNGGIQTGYTSTSGNIRSDTDTNVETTSICLLYLTIPPPPPPIPTYYLSLRLTSPTSIIYTTNTVPLNYSASTNGTGLLVKYSLNNQANISLSGDTALTGLTNGQYTLTIYASIDQGNEYTSSTNFVIDVPTPTPPTPIITSPPPTEANTTAVPTVSPSPSLLELALPALVLALIIPASAAVLYRKKSKPRTNV